MVANMFRKNLFVLCMVFFPTILTHAAEEVCGEDEATCSTTPSSNDNDTEPLIQNLIRNIENHEGAFNSDKQEIRYLEEIDGYGVFAKEDIPMGTELVKIPWGMLIHDTTLPQDENISTFCKVNKNLKQIFETQASDPYMQYLSSILNSPIPPVQRIPEFFTPMGHQLLALVTGVNLPPEDFTDDFKNGIGAELSENCPDVSREFASLHQRTSSFSYMVPLFDLYKHHNHENFLNTENFGYRDDFVGLKAKRDIKSGEQIHLSRNKCEFCGHKENSDAGTVLLARETGIVEPYPQLWSIGNKLYFEVHEESVDHFVIEWVNEERPTYNDISFLTEEKLRLWQINNEIHQSEHVELPTHELDFVRSYHVALSIAVGAVLNDIDETLKVEDDDEYMGDAYVHAEDEINFRNHRQTCREWFHEFRAEHRSWEGGQRNSQYQEIWFYENPKRNDKCLELDDVVQICANYRPFYHEPFVHFPASLLPEMKRVAFIGGGDSMLLHEVLKYPNIEKVIGLELDQMVVRNSFRILYTQPHFDDERVEWWFGDATKSLNVLPKEYFGSFDLVMVDLSETVMSFSVTDQLDMVQALALLTKPDGIFVKNEHYYDTLTKYFDYTVELYLEDNPLICDQHFALGSNRIDFLHPNFDRVKEYNVETLLYQHLNDTYDHHNMLVQYSKNDARKEKQCQDDFDRKSFDLVKAGVLMILEAEQSALLKNSRDESLEAIVKVLEHAGLSPIHSKTYSAKYGGYFSFVVMREGYVSMRTWPSHSYIAFDLQLWASFEKMDKLKKSMINIAGSDDWSSFRIVVCGMHGTSTWDEDKLKIGPKIVSSRDCENGSKTEVDYRTSIDVLYEETLFSFSNDSLVIALCDPGDCIGASVLKKYNNLNVNVITSCSNDVNNSESSSDSVKSYSLCGNNFETLLKLITMKSQTKIDAFFIDPMVPESTNKILGKILGRKDYQRSLFKDHFVTVSPISEYAGDERKSTLSDVAKKQFRRPLTIELNLGNKNDEGNNVQVLFMSVGDTSFYSNLNDVADRVKARLGFDVEITRMKGKHITFQDNYRSKDYILSDYDTDSALQQYSEQVPLGYQSVFQFGKGKDQEETDDNKGLSFDTILTSFESSLKQMSVEQTESFSESIGDGLLAYTYFEQGHAVVIWDGKDRVDFVVFTYENDATFSLYHKEDFAIPFGELVGMDLLLVDEQPRGVKHVVNLLDDIDVQKEGCWNKYHQCDYFQSVGNCASDSEFFVWMKDNCAMSCGFC